MTDLEVFNVVHEIADYAFKFWSSDISHSVWLMDSRGSMVNPMYNVTEKGIFLEIVDLRPDCLYTPWGEWSPWGNNGVSSKKFLDLFRKKMNLESSLRGHNWVYRVMKFGDLELPVPELRREEYNPEELKNEWKKLSKAVMI